MIENSAPRNLRLDIFQPVAEALLARHGWSLLTAETLTMAAAHSADPMTTPTRAEAERACQQIYAQHLYAAAQDPQRHETAYRELHAYLYRIALRQRPAIAEDAAQEAILLVHQKLHTCRSPGAFLKFAIYQLLTTFHRLAPSAHEISLEEELSHQCAEDSELPFMAETAELSIEVATRTDTATLLQWLHRVIEANPRAQKQILAVALKYLEEWEDEAIAAALATSVANVQVLRSRGLVKLREEYQKHFSQVQDS